ncbi:DUF2851 family protein [Tenacibaculum crassostreae]|uniref:DUF2851 family protein n=1 Tax=Tenacibaculum crassostreae TaxID=502683 RepID=UPI0038949F59
MKEDFLHYLWQHKLFDFGKLTTVNKEKIEVIKTGLKNTNSGPDFFNAQLKVDEQLWIGNIEIHVKSSDWYLHHHEKDENYDAVILHVVWEYDAEVFMKNNKPLPTLELSKFVNKEVFVNYQKLFSKEQRWIPCEQQIAEVDSFLLHNWLERLYFERLGQKSILINELLEQSNNDYEAVLFQLLAKNFGLKVNGDAFLRLAQSLDFSVVRKVRFDKQQLAALLFGQAGFFEETIEDVYFLSLKKEYEYLKYKFQLKPISKSTFQFFRMRPNNFPTIRLAQLIALYYHHQNLFSQVLEVSSLKDFYMLFSVEVNGFWKSHYTFETASKKSPKRLTQSFIDLLVINTIIPLKFAYEKSRGGVDEEKLLHLIKQVKPEKNTMISKFSDINIKSKNAFETQALLELKNNYCAKKRCLQCAIGNSLIKS